MSEKLNILINWVENISKQAHINSEREHTRLINAISVIDESVPLRKYKIDAHNKPVLAGALLSVSECVDPYGNMVVELLQSVKELSDKCLDLQKEVDVYKEIMHGHSQNFTNASQLINQLEPVMSKIESLSNTTTEIKDLRNTQNESFQMLQSIQESLVKPPTPKTPVPVIDYAKIASLIPKPATPPAAVNVNKVVRLTTEEIEKKDNLMIYGLRRFHPPQPRRCTGRRNPIESVNACVDRFFKTCGVEPIRTSRIYVCKVILISDSHDNPVIRLVMNSEEAVDKILGHAKELRNTEFKKVFLSKDRTKRGQDRRREAVSKLKQKIVSFPDRRWAIVRGAVVEKGPFKAPVDSTSQAKPNVIIPRDNAK